MYNYSIKILSASKQREALRCFALFIIDSKTLPHQDNLENINKINNKDIEFGLVIGTIMIIFLKESLPNHIKTRPGIQGREMKIWPCHNH